MPIYWRLKVVVMEFDRLHRTEFEDQVVGNLYLISRCLTSL